MTLKVKSTIAIVFGGLLIALALYYGMSGDMHSSITERGANIERWEKELVESRVKTEQKLAEMDRLGKKTDATPEERRRFEYMVDSLERDTQSLRHQRDMIEDERESRKHIILITAGLALLGLASIVVGFLLRRRRA